MKKKDINIKNIKREIKKALKRTREGLKKMGAETAVFAKRSEKELSKITRVGKVEVDILSLNIKKNQLYHALGKKVHQLNAQGKLTTKNLKKLCTKIDDIEKNLKSKKRSISKYLKKK